MNDNRSVRAPWSLDTGGKMAFVKDASKLVYRRLAGWLTYRARDTEEPEPPAEVDRGWCRITKDSARGQIVIENTSVTLRPWVEQKARQFSAQVIDSNGTQRITLPLSVTDSWGPWPPKEHMALVQFGAVVTQPSATGSLGPVVSAPVLMSREGLTARPRGAETPVTPATVSRPRRIASPFSTEEVADTFELGSPTAPPKSSK
jgi:hypothetical protein